MFASDFRRIAREALQGKWIRTALILLLASLLGASVGVQTTPFLSIDFDIEIPARTEEVGLSMDQFMRLYGVMMGMILVIILVSLFVGALVRIGMFCMGDAILDGETPRAGMLFPGGYYKTAVKLWLLRTVKVTLWSFLFIIPGIIAAYRYAMAEYFLSRNPALSATEAIELSKKRMNGNKGRLFGLEISYIGWAALSSLPASIGVTIGAALAYGGSSLVAAAVPIFIGGLASFAASVLLSAYIHIGICAFFRSLYEGGTIEAERPDFDWGDAEDDGVNSPPDLSPIENEPAAKDLFFAYGCSRARMREADVLEEYENYRVDPSAEHRWIQDWGNMLMYRFSSNPDALDDLLSLVSEYALDDLLDRAIERIARHIRQETLPGQEVLNMLGRVLALVSSGAFAGRESYVERKKAQIGDIAQRLEHSLEKTDPDGDWQNALRLIRQMCE